MAATDPSISVLLPIRNGAVYLSECIDSLKAQTFDDFEVLAVDDGSTDRTPQILAQWASEDRRVVVTSRAPMGITAALEAGRLRARGRYLARMDSDDIAEATRFEDQLSLLEDRPELSGCGAHVRYFPREAVRDGGLRYEAWLNGITTPADVEREIFVECPLAHPTFFFRSSAVSAVGGYSLCGWPEDYDLLLRLWQSGQRFGVADQVLLHWREREDRASRKQDEYSPEAFRRCKVHYLLRTLASGRNGLVVWGAGPLGKSFAREVQRQGGEVRAFVDLDGRKIGQTIHGATVVPPSSINEYRDGYCVAAVGQVGARAEIRDALEGAGWLEIRDFIAVA